MLTGMTSRAQGLAYLDASSTGGSCQPRLIQIQPALPKFRLRPRHGHHGLIEHSDGLQWLGVTKRAVCSALAGLQLCPKNRHWQRPAQPSGSSSCWNPQIARDFCMFGPGTGLPPGGPSGCRGGVAGGRGRSCVPLHTARFRPAARLRGTDCGADFTTTSRDPGVTRSHGRACPAPLRRPSAPTQCLRRTLGEPAANLAASRAMKYPCDP